MAGDQFIKIDGIDGEAQDSEHKGEIDVLSFNWVLSQACSAQDMKARERSRPRIDDFSFRKYVDKSSPKLMNHLTKGALISKVIFSARKAGSPSLTYLVIEMSDVAVIQMNTGIQDSKNPDVLMEDITLNFMKVSFVYQEQSKDGGKYGGKVESKWDIAANSTF